VTQHLGYQSAAERVELAPPQPSSKDGHCVLIPISKSEDWWSLAHDERSRAFRDEEPRGHIRVGRPYASRIFRKLYHSRYVPGSSWDFLTYFEFPAECAGDFTALLRGLRDTQRNPEWSFVVREVEIWMRRIQD
jgi:chlorite dismutase